MIDDLYPGLHVPLAAGYLSGEGVEQSLRSLELVPVRAWCDVGRVEKDTRLRGRPQRHAEGYGEAETGTMVHVSAGAISMVVTVDSSLLTVRPRSSCCACSYGSPARSRLHSPACITIMNTHYTDIKWLRRDAPVTYDFFVVQVSVHLVEVPDPGLTDSTEVAHFVVNVEIRSMICIHNSVVVSSRMNSHSLPERFERIFLCPSPRVLSVFPREKSPHHHSGLPR